MFVNLYINQSSFLYNKTSGCIDFYHVFFFQIESTIPGRLYRILRITSFGYKVRYKLTIKNLNCLYWFVFKKNVHRYMYTYRRLQRFWLFSLIDSSQVTRPID